MMRYKETSKKGFTLAELLIVVAIIAIIVAISIPIFTGKLEEARKQTDFANVRAAKGVAVTMFMQEESWQQEFEQSDKKPKEIIRYYDAENGTFVGYEAAKKLKPYNQFEWNNIAKKGTSIIVVFIREEFDENGESSTVFKYAWEWPKYLPK